jgi:hypothetical protein
MLSHNSFVIVSDPSFVVSHWETVNDIICSSGRIGSGNFLETYLHR